MNNRVVAGVALAILLMCVPARAATIYTTFQSCNTGVDMFCTPDGRTYNLGAGHTVDAQNDPFNIVGAAMGFTLTDTFTFDAAELALTAYVSGDLATVSLMSDSGGTPGTILETFHVAAPDYLSQYDLTVSPLGLIPPLRVESILHPILTAGTQYWLAVSGVSAWDFNSNPQGLGGTDGTVADHKTSGEWIAYTAPQGAFAIEGTASGTPVPEPATVMLLGVSALGLVGARARSGRRDE